MVVDGRTMEPLLEEALQTLSQVRVEPISWKRHDDRDAAVVEVSADEHADATVAFQWRSPPSDDGARPPTPGTARPWGTTRTASSRPCSRATRIRSSAVSTCSSLWCRSGVLAAGSMYAFDVKRPIMRASPTISPRDSRYGRRCSPCGRAGDGGVRVGLGEDQQVTILDASPEPRIERVQQRRFGERRTTDVREDAEAAPGTARIARPSGVSASSYSR